ncbi:MAG: PatB family C-S lyase [Bacteroidota bacterium]|nr:PatB family C-S lyase [Bacteroidota bacterium]MDP4227387.1 PatB family C-S lyase [Bacteroidota bacterium]
MQYNFDETIDRNHTNCEKYDERRKFFGTEEVLPMWVADMDFRTPDFIVNAIKKRADHEIYGYSFQPESFYEAIIYWLNQRHQWKVKRNWLTVSPGIVTALNMAVLAYSRPGDKVIIQPPVYFPFMWSVRNNGRQLVFNQLKKEGNQYKMDFEDLEKKIDKRTKLFFLCNPHNPGGRVWTKSELKRLSEICVKHGIVMVSDEIHSDIIYSGHKHIPLAMVSEDAAQNTVTFVAPSKTFNIAGLTTSEVIIPNQKLFDKFRIIQENIHLGESNIFGITALEAAYQHGEEWLEQLLHYLEGNLDFIDDFLKKRLPQIKLIRPESTFLAWLNCEDLGLNDNELKKFMIEKAKVALNPGPDFGPGGEGFMRLNFGCPRKTLNQGLEQIAAAVDKL